MGNKRRFTHGSYLYRSIMSCAGRGRSGTALIMVLLSVATLTVICCKDRWATYLLTDVTVQKERYEKAWWAVHGLLQYGIAYGVHNFTYLQDRLMMQPTVTITCAQWPVMVGKRERAHVVFTRPAENTLDITASLENEHGIKGSCRVSCSPSGTKKMVSSWTLQ